MIRSFLSKNVLFGVAIAAPVLAFLTFIYSFLAVTSPVGQGVLVVEAWISPRALAESLKLFHAGRYSRIVVVGGPLPGTVSQSASPATWDEVAAKTLKGLGLDPNQLVQISVPPVAEGHRTLASAIAVKDWLRRCDNCLSVDVLTAGVHARKSWTVFRYVLGDHYRVGIIAGPEEAYDRRFWFFSTTAIWYVIRDLAGYIYSKVWIPLSAQSLDTIARSSELIPEGNLAEFGKLPPV